MTVQHREQQRQAARFEADGHAVWWDRQLAGGSDFTTEIERELMLARVVLVLWSARVGRVDGQGLDGSAVFELFVRALPAQRNFLLLAGIEQALAFLEQLRFDPGELDWLRATGRFRTDFLDWLSELRFTGEVHAMREGTVFFTNEPVLRVEAPIAQAQLVESRLLNLIHCATLVASKAARCRLAAPDSLLVDFGLRRAHGAEAGLVAARSSYLAGFAGSATVLAGQYYGIPVFGTMAHSYVEVHELEVQAFRAYADSLTGLRGPLMLLIDTYDTEAAARKIVALAPALERRGARIASVRLDSGDLVAHARLVRTIFDQGGLQEISIFASGSLDEWRLRQLLQASGFDDEATRQRLLRLHRVLQPLHVPFDAVEVADVEVGALEGAALVVGHDALVERLVGELPARAQEPGERQQRRGAAQEEAHALHRIFASGKPSNPFKQLA